MKNVSKLIPIPLYGGYFHVFTSKKKLIKVAGDAVPNEVVDGCGGICISASDNGEMRFLIGVFDGRQDTLVHELYHMTDMLSASVGFKDDESGEAQAYLIQYFFKESTKYIKEKN